MRHWGKLEGRYSDAFYQSRDSAGISVHTAVPKYQSNHVRKLLS